MPLSKSFPQKAFREQFIYGIETRYNSLLMQILEDGGYAIRDRIDIPDGGLGDFIFGRGWLLEIVELESGDYYFYSDGQEVRPPGRRFGIFYPQFTFVRASSHDLKGEVFGVGSEHVPDGLPTSAFVFDTDRRQPFTRTDEALEVLENGHNRQSIDVCTKPSLVSLKAKKLIDGNYSIYPSIARIAARLDISHAHLSRQFKKDYGLTPSSYLHHLRVADATFRLSLGQEIIDISHDVGYNDLSRFYRQFRKSTSTSPAVCRGILNNE